MKIGATVADRADVIESPGSLSDSSRV